MNKIFCSTGAVTGRPNGRDFRLLKQCGEMLDCDGYELLMYDDWREKIDELKSFLSGTDLSFPVFHIEKDVGNLLSRNGDGDVERAYEIFDINCALASEIGASKLVLHLWGGLDSDRDFPHSMECYKVLRGISDSHKLLLTVENVVCNRRDPMSRLTELAEAYPDALFTFDTKMSEFHGQTDLLYKEENRWLFRKTAHMHINDYAGGYMDWGSLKTLHIGEGHVDFAKLFAFLKEQDYKGDFTVEATSFDQSGKIDFNALNNSISKLRNLTA